MEMGTFTCRTWSYIGDDVPDVDVYLLLEVSSILLVHQHKVQVVPDTELLIDITHSWGQVVPEYQSINHINYNQSIAQNKFPFFLLQFLLSLPGIHG